MVLPKADRELRIRCSGWQSGLGLSLQKLGFATNLAPLPVRRRRRRRRLLLDEVLHTRRGPEVPNFANFGLSGLHFSFCSKQGLPKSFSTPKSCRSAIAVV